MKLSILAVLILIQGAIFNKVYAYDHYNNTITTSTIVQEKSGVATAIATGQCQFDWSHALQGCAAIGSWEGEQAFAIGLGKRAGDMLFTGTLAIESGGLFAGGAGVNIKFK